MQSPAPLFLRPLRAFDGVLAKAEAHCEARRIDPAALLNDRLYPDMLPFTRQVQIATDHAKGLARLTGAEPPRWEDTEASFGALRERVSRAAAFVEAMPDDAFADADGREVVLRLRMGERRLTGTDYLQGFAIPNFFFHLTTAYAILRHRGVELGKRDFLGAP